MYRKFKLFLAGVQIIVGIAFVVLASSRISEWRDNGVVSDAVAFEGLSYFVGGVFLVCGGALIAVANFRPANIQKKEQE